LLEVFHCAQAVFFGEVVGLDDGHGIGFVRVCCVSVI
jgi:hypothetical protein